jgi:predicted ferric reductase
MATQVTSTNVEPIRRTILGTITPFLALAALLGTGLWVAGTFAATVRNPSFPWITARALGISAYLAIFALVSLGLWMRHPWRFRFWAGHPDSRIRMHATLGVTSVALLLGHIAFLASDRFAGVGWAGAFAPGLAHYRTTAVALGVVAFYLVLVIAATARFAGRRGARHWLGVHRLASAAFAFAWFHGVLAGTDTPSLRVLYVLTGTGVALLAGTRWMSRQGNPVAVRAPGAASSEAGSRDTLAGLSR